MILGLVRSKEVFVLADGALRIWNSIEDRGCPSTQNLAFYRGSQHFWRQEHQLYPESPELAAAWTKLLLHHLCHTPEHRVIHTLEELLAGNPDGPIVHREGRHLQNHRDHLNEADLAARNTPSDSGSMESVCGQL